MNDPELQTGKHKQDNEDYKGRDQNKNEFPGAAESQIVAAVVSLPMRPCSRRIAPALKKPIPVTIFAATRVRVKADPYLRKKREQCRANSNQDERAKPCGFISEFAFGSDNGPTRIATPGLMRFSVRLSLCGILQ